MPYDKNDDINTSDNLKGEQIDKMIKLSREDSKAFVDALINPKPPNDALMKAAKLHEKFLDNDPA